MAAVKPGNPMIEAALERGEDTTGLCTVREVAAHMVERGGDSMEMWFTHEGRKYSVLVIVLAVD